MFLNRNIKIPNKNSIYHLSIGLIFLGMAGWVAFKGMERESGIDQFDWVYIAAFAITGVYFGAKGVKAIFSKAYIRVDDEKIAVKPDESTESVTIFWRDIRLIRDKNRNFEIVKNDNTVYVIHFSYYTYKNADDLQEAIRIAAFKKGIKIEQVKIL